MFTRSMRPTKPMSSPPGAERRATRNSEPSSPHRPTAGCPCRFRRNTISLLIFPIKTIFATSTVSLLDTRRPPTNSIGSPSRSMYALISGPPPWTTIGLRPTYFSSTTSRANSSRSAASSIAAPPYLMTTVLPWNSLMYGNASSSVPTSRMGWAPISCRVVGVDGDVLMREVGEEQLGLGALAGEPDLVLDLRHRDGARERLLVVGDRCSPGAHLDALDGDVDGQRVGARERAPDGLDDASPVGVAAVQRGLHERRVGHRAGGRLDVGLIAAAHVHARDAPRALAVGDHHDRQLAQQRVERFAETQLVLALGLHADAAGPRAHQHRGVVRGELPVDGRAVEGALDAHAEQQVGGR